MYVFSPIPNQSQNMVPEAVSFAFNKLVYTTMSVYVVFLLPFQQISVGV